jgi:hypothetical protein
MYKFILVLIFIFSGCANYSVNGTMCDEIAPDPKELVPQECQVYNEQKAAEASTNEEEILDPNDAIEFETKE